MKSLSAVNTFLMILQCVLLLRNNISVKSFKKLPNLRNFSSRKFDSVSTEKESNFFITTPIYYVNGEPHLGHAYTSVISDIIARFHRKDNVDVYFLTGTDEHGQKVEQSAMKAKKSPLTFADEVSAKFDNLAKSLDCSYDDFIRTTEDRHKKAVSELWKILEEKGQIYLGAYEGWYSIRDEAFYAESELVDGKAPTGAEVEWVKEESYFFRLSEYTDKLLDYYEKNPDFIAPAGRKNEVVSFVGQEGGLKDLSISRTTFSWGVKVPNSESHIVYVWLDALTNYLSALGFPDRENEKFKKFWPASLHIVGKDILRFHAIFWPAFLMAADLPLPKRVFAHGWWTKDGEKMSKSLGNVLDPFELISQYGVDYVRYFMAAEINFGNDGDFSHDSFCSKINSELSNDFGNLLQRVLTMIKKNCDGKVPEYGDFVEDDLIVLKSVKDSLPLIRSQIKKQNIKGACDSIIDLAKKGNKYIDTQAPWVLLKTDKPRVFTVLYVLLEVVRACGILLEPIMPKSSNKILDQIGAPPEFRTFDSIEKSYPTGLAIGTPSPIFPKVEPPSLVDSKLESGELNEKNPLELKYDGFELDKIGEEINNFGNLIRQMKNEKKNKKELKPFIDELLFLKDR